MHETKFYATSKRYANWFPLKAQSLARAKREATMQCHVYRDDVVTISVIDEYGYHVAVAARERGKWTEIM